MCARRKKPGDVQSCTRVDSFLHLVANDMMIHDQHENYRTKQPQTLHEHVRHAHNMCW